MRKSSISSVTAESAGGRHAVQFAAIACGENHGFLEDAPTAQLASRVQRLLGGECHALAKFDRGGAMVAANQRDAYAPGCAPGRRSLRVGSDSHQKKRWNLVRYKFTSV